MGLICRGLPLLPLLLLSVKALPVPSVPRSNSALGHIYSIARNASTNEFQFIDVDLTTWETSVGPLPTGFGEVPAAAYQNGLYWTEQFVDATTHLLAAINVTSKTAVASINISTWVPAPKVILAIFPAPSRNGLLLVTKSLPNGGEDLFIVADPANTATVTHIGAVDCYDCGDWAWDGEGEVLYAVANEESSDPNGTSLIGFALSNASAPVVVANFTLPDAFEFPQWDAAAPGGALFGLSLITGGPNGYARNLTILNNPPGGLNATSHGTIGEGLYVILEGGPKAFDPVSRRAFYMLATGPLAEFDVVAVDVDADPVTIAEAPPLCGFIGYCPEAFVFGSGD